MTKTLYTIDDLLMYKNQYSDILILVLFIFAGCLWFAVRLIYGSVQALPLSDIFYFILFAPVAEELFFRGVLQDTLKQRTNRRISALTYANIFTSLVFAAVHIPFWGAMHSSLVFIPSLIFGFLYDRTGKIIFPVILHMFYNLNIFIV